MDWSYLAGFFDGEGSICLARGGSYRYKDVERRPTYRPLMTLSNNHEGVLHRAAAFIGFGSVFERKRTDPAHRQSYVYTIAGLRVEPVLSGMLPHLIIKLEQAHVALEFIKRRRVQMTRPFDETDFNLIRRMQELNNRSPHKGTMIQPVPTVKKRAQCASH